MKNKNYTVLCYKNLHNLILFPLTTLTFEIENSINVYNIFNYKKNKFKYSLIKDPSETSSLEYIKQQI